MYRENTENNQKFDRFRLSLRDDQSDFITKTENYKKNLMVKKTFHIR